MTDDAPPSEPDVVDPADDAALLLPHGADIPAGVDPATVIFVDQKLIDSINNPDMSTRRGLPRPRRLSEPMDAPPVFVGTIGEVRAFLAYSRLAQGMQQWALGEALGLSQPSVAGMEKSGGLTLPHLDRWAAALGMRVRIALFADRTQEGTSETPEE